MITKTPGSAMPVYPPKALVERLLEELKLDQPVDVRPLSGGRTNAVWKIRTGGRDVVLKLYAPLSSNPLFPNDAMAEQTCLHHLAASPLVPEWLGSGVSDFGDWVLHGFVDGTIWQSDTGAVARALLQLHRHAPPQGLRIAPNGSTALERQTLDILERCQDSRADTLSGHRPNGAVPATSATVLLHGDPVPGNIICSAGALTFIDWQCPAIGDACEDLAIFLSPAMQHLYRGHPLSLGEESQFLSAYAVPEVTERYRLLAPWFHWRMAAYCLWRAETGDRAYGDAFALEEAALMDSLS